MPLSEPICCFHLTHSLLVHVCHGAGTSAGARFAQLHPSAWFRRPTNAEALVAKYQDLDATLPDNVQLQVADTRFPAIDLLFQYEGHTLGNLLETYLGMNHVTVEGVAEGKAEPKLSYVAYKVPHPLKAEMVLRIGCLGGSETPVETQKQIARSAVSVVCRNLKDQFRALKESWMRATSA